jgi:hypothetical protein
MNGAVAASGVALSLSACALVAGLGDSRLDDAGDDAGAEVGADSPGPSDAPPPDTADARAWAPSDLGRGLVVWLDASKGVTVTNGRVSHWTDLSTYGNDATQSVAGARPVVDTGVVAQHDAIKFDGNTLFIADAASLQWGVDDYLIEVVAEYTNTPSSSQTDGYAALWNKGDSTFPFYGPALFANTVAGTPDSRLLVQVKTPEDTSSIGWVNSARRGLNDAKFHVFAARRKGQTTLQARVDGEPTAATIGVFNVSSVGTSVTLGSAATTTIQLLRGDIAELVAFHGALSEDDVGRLEAYLKAKYAL